MGLQFEIGEVEERPCAFIRRRVEQRELGAFFGEVLPKVAQHVGMSGGRPMMPFGRYLEWGEHDCVVEGGFVTAEPVAGGGEIESGTIGAKKAVKTTHVGPYDGLSKTHMAVWQYVQDHGLEIAGDQFEIYIDPHDSTPPEKLRTEIAWPVK